jgi:hypothetical protein
MVEFIVLVRDALLAALLAWIGVDAPAGREQDGDRRDTIARHDVHPAAEG